MSVPVRADALSVERRRWAGGVAALDRVLGGGWVYGCLHECLATDVDDAAAAAGFAVAVASGMAGQRGLLWLRSQRAARLGGWVQAVGWGEMGGCPGAALLGVVPDGMALLRAAVDALRCPALGAVIVEDWGAMPALDLTASRRLALAAERSGVPLFLLRVDAKPVPSAAQTRWQVAAAPSRALPGHAPGLPTFDVALLRQRSGPAGLDWRLEWDRDQYRFHDAAPSGAVVPLSAGRTAAGAGGGQPDSLHRYVA